MSLLARRLEGDSETFIRATVQNTDAEVFIYEDEAGLVGANVDKRFEVPDYHNSDALAEAFIQQTIDYAQRCVRPS